MAGSDDDVCVWSALVARDEAALTDLYERYAALVHTVAVRLLRDPVAAQDVVQEVFEQVWRRPDGYDPAAGSVRSWLALLARRRAIDAIRHTARQRRRAVGAAAPGDPPDPAEAAVDASLARDLRAAVRALPEPQRVAVLLAYVGGHTAREIAERLGIPEGTAKSRLRLGLRRISRALAERGLLE
jgi:RNA polymerase sigma factor (sigma-70 family)